MTTRPRTDKSRRVAIAGANGMVGHQLVEALQASGDRVIALVREPSAHRRGFGGTLGPGGQWFSWIHVNDAARLVLHALDQETITGPLISASPNPVTSREFAKIFAHTLHRPRLFPMSSGMMKLL